MSISRHKTVLSCSPTVVPIPCACCGSGFFCFPEIPKAWIKPSILPASLCFAFLYNAMPCGFLQNTTIFKRRHHYIMCPGGLEDATELLSWHSILPHVTSYLNPLRWILPGLSWWLSLRWCGLPNSHPIVRDFLLWSTCLYHLYPISGLLEFLH